jgi:hypothetical protein
MLTPLLLAALATTPTLPQDAPHTALAQEAPEPAPFDHRPLDALLQRHVKGERVDYAGLLRDRAMLDMYTARLEDVTPERLAAWDADERFAFWTNTYNAFTLRLILDHYRLADGGALASITDLSFPGEDGATLNAWQQPLIELRAFHPDGLDRALTLDQVENRILRPAFGDARVHAAVNCASIGCPPLRAAAFTGADLDAQLDDQLAAFLAGPRNAFDRAAGVVGLSKIFEWYGVDFVDEAAGTDLADWLVQHGPASAGSTPAERAWIRDARIEFLEYDWALNDIERERP